MKVTLFITVLFMSVTAVLSAQELKYELKSAIVKKETIAMGQKIESTWYMDDFGKKESSETITKVGGVAGIEKQIRTIIDGNSIINVDMNMKTAMRMQMPLEPINYLNLTPEIIDKFKIEELGEEDVVSRSCKKYTLEISQMGQTMGVTAWVWKGLVLKSETAANGMVIMKEIAIEVEENVSVPVDKFIIPEGIVIPE